MLALGDRRDHLADVDAVLDDGIAGPVVLERDLVTDRDIALRRHDDVFVVLHDPAGERLPGLDAFDDDDAHAVALLVHDEMNHTTLRYGSIREALFYAHVPPPEVPADAWCPRHCERVLECAALHVVSVHARRRVRLSVAERRGALDAAHRLARSRLHSGPLGNRGRRGDAQGGRIRDRAGECRMGALGSRRAEYPSV